MRVAFDIGPLGPSPAGVGVYAASLARALGSLAGDVDVSMIGLRPDADLDAGAVSVMRRPGGPYLVWLQRQAMRDVAAAGAALAHFSDGVVPFRRSLPAVLTVHDLSVLTMPRSHPMRRWSRAPLVALSPRLANRVIVPSTATADEVMRVCGVSARRIRVSPYAPRQDVAPTWSEVEAVTRRLGLAPDGYVLALGTVEPRKNHVRLIQAFGLAIQTGRLPRDLRLVIAGRLGWRHGSVSRAIESSPVRHRIESLGFVADSDIPCLLSGARMSCYISLYEGFGLPVVESLACGTPTVTSNRSSMPEVAGEAGFLVDPLDPLSIANGMAAAYEAGNDRPSIAQASRAQAAKFSWSRAARETVDVYRDVFERG